MMMMMMITCSDFLTVNQPFECFGDCKVFLWCIPNDDCIYFSSVQFTNSKPSIRLQNEMCLQLQQPLLHCISGIAFLTFWQQIVHFLQAKIYIIALLRCKSELRFRHFFMNIYIHSSSRSIIIQIITINIIIIIIINHHRLQSSSS